MSSQPRRMPTMQAIADYWAANEPDWLKSRWVGWGEPFCFACGWMPPIPDGQSNSWRLATPWLDRAHLHDRANGGPDDASNIVPLCHLCHDAMPEMMLSTADGLQWVRDRPTREPMFQWWTDHKLTGRRPTRSTTMLRARMRYLERMRCLEVAEGQVARLGGCAIHGARGGIAVDHVPR